MTQHQETQHPPDYMLMDNSAQMQVTRALLPASVFLGWLACAAFFLITGLLS